MCRNCIHLDSLCYMCVGAYPGGEPRDAPAKSKEVDEMAKEGDKDRYPTTEDETMKAAIDDELPMRTIETKALYQEDGPSASGPLHADLRHEVEETDDESLYDGEA